MKIATYGIASLHDRFISQLSQRGFTEPVARYDETTVQERQNIHVLFGWGITQSVIDECPRLEWIQGAGAGVDWLTSVRLNPSTRVTRIVDQFGPDMGEYALLAVLAWVKNWRRIFEQQARGEWSPYLVGQMSALRVGILGAGSIGAHVASMFRPLVLEVRALGRHRPDLPGIAGFAADDWPTFYRGLDVLVMVLPHTPDTYHLVGSPQLALMREGGYLVNMGRGMVLDPQALYEAIGSGRLSGAALDVFEEEPLPEDSPLWTLSGVTVSPHISGPSRVAGMADVFVENFKRFDSGLALAGVVDWERGY